MCGHAMVPTARHDKAIRVRRRNMEQALSLEPDIVADRLTKQVAVSATELAQLLFQAAPHVFIPEIAELVASWLRVVPVEMADVTVPRWSSHAADQGGRYTFHPSCTLEPGDESCWISSAPRSSDAPEYLEYVLAGPAAAVRRVDFVSMQIPVLPHGPLSVRCFALETWDDDYDGVSVEVNVGASGDLAADEIGEQPPGFPRPGGWHRDPAHSYETLDVAGLQRYAVVPPIEARAVRLVCLTNAIGSSSDPIGFWCIHFE